MIAQVEQNGDRFLKTLIDHIKERKDIERLAAVLNYEPAQIETDVEDFVAMITEYRENLKKT